MNPFGNDPFGFVTYCNFLQPNAPLRFYPDGNEQDKKEEGEDELDL